MWPFLLGSGGVAYGFIGANTSRESRTKFMSYYRVTCMAGVMSSTIGELQIIHARTTRRLIDYISIGINFSSQDQPHFAGWSLQLAILTTINTLNICTLFLVCYYHSIFNIYCRHHHQIVVTITVFIIIIIIIIIISSPLSSLPPLPPSS